MLKYWFTSIDPKKWSALKDALDVAVKLLYRLRVMAVSHNNIFSRLGKSIPKDPNITVVAFEALVVTGRAGR